MLIRCHRLLAPYGQGSPRSLFALHRGGMCATVFFCFCFGVGCVPSAAAVRWEPATMFLWGCRSHTVVMLLFVRLVLLGSATSRCRLASASVMRSTNSGAAPTATVRRLMHDSVMDLRSVFQLTSLHNIHGDRDIASRNSSNGAVDVVFAFAQGCPECARAAVHLQIAAAAIGGSGGSGRHGRSAAMMASNHSRWQHQRHQELLRLHEQHGAVRTVTKVWQLNCTRHLQLCLRMGVVDGRAIKGDADSDYSDNNGENTSHTNSSGPVSYTHLTLPTIYSV